MPKVKQIDIKAIFEKATGHKIVEPITKAYPMESKPLAEVPPTE